MGFRLRVWIDNGYRINHMQIREELNRIRVWVNEINNNNIIITKLIILIMIINNN